MTDSQLITVIRHLCCADDIPLPPDVTITPLDKLLTIRLLMQKADEVDVYPSQDTLSQQCGVAVSALIRSQQRLIKAGWLTVHSGGYRMRTNLYSVVIDKLPIADLHKTIVTDAAQRLARGYAKYLRKTAKKRLWRNWEQQASFVCQKLIEQANNDLDLAKNVINFALCDPRFRKQALKGPRGLRRHWKQIVREFQVQKASEVTQ